MLVGVLGLTGTAGFGGRSGVVEFGAVVCFEEGALPLTGCPAAGVDKDFSNLFLRAYLSCVLSQDVVIARTKNNRPQIHVALTIPFTPPDAPKKPVVFPPPRAPPKPPSLPNCKTNTKIAKITASMIKSVVIRVKIILLS